MACQPLVDSRGQENQRTGCPVDPACAAVAHERARLAATCAPDFIWVDDHCRMRQGCFCPRCLAGFQDGAWSERAELVAALDAPDRSDLRQAWIAYTAQRLSDFCAGQRAAVDAVDPAIAMGFMMVGGDSDAACGTYVTDCCRALRAVKARPGHGWYRDDDRIGLLRKTLEDARTISQRLPEHTTDIQHEYESWPGGSLDKGRRSSVLEITNAIAAGCTGVAMNARHAMGVPSERDAALHQALAQQRAFWRELVAVSRGLPLQGMLLPQDSDRLARVPLHGAGLWDADRQLVTAAAQADQWYAHGVPPAVTQAQANGVFLPGSVAAWASDEQLRAWLHGFAILDGDAVRVCHERGLGALVGVTAGEFLPSVHERLSAHPLNGSAAGAEYVDPAPWVWPLQVQEETVAVLGDLLDLRHRVVGAATTCYENPAGGRVAVLGHCPWHRIDLPARWQQLQAILRWGTHDRMPVAIDQPVRVLPWWRCSTDGSRGVLVASNLSLDETGPLRISLRCTARRARLLAATGADTGLVCERSAEHLVCRIADIPAWSAVAIVAE
ncbi:MAG: hypothetical protein ACOCXJ_02360, partial [Planctomycetota bacterium]